MSKLNLFENALKKSGLNLKKGEPLAKYSTLQVGGKSDFLVMTENSDQLKEMVLLARNYEHPFMIIGKGSNIIFSDEGYKGLLIINTSKKWEIVGEISSEKSTAKTSPRFISGDSGFEYEDKRPDSIRAREVLIRTDSGVGINYLIHELYKKGITGLQWYTGIPATVGGAIYMNMHGGEYFFGDLVQSATLVDGESIKKVANDYFQFNYDWSILHQTREIIIEAELRLIKGNVEETVKLTNEWARHKSQQPRRSAGCIFRNLSEEEQERHNLPTSSVGYLIDKVLGLKGKRIGDAVISEKHAAFIENCGHATAREVYDLIQLIKQKARTQFGLELKEEVQFIGRF